LGSATCVEREPVEDFLQLWILGNELEDGSRGEVQRPCNADAPDLRPDGLALVKRLVALSDIVVENFSPGTLARMGLGYDELKRIKSDIILVSVSALGQSGPLSSYRAFGLQLFAMSGLSVLSAPPGAPPAVVRGGGADPVTGVYAALASMIALRHRNQTGEGQRVDISMLETTLAHLPDAVMEVTLNGRVPDPMGNEEHGSFPVACFPCRGEDKWIAIAVHDAQEWGGLCRAIDAPDLLEESKFGSAKLRCAHRDEILSRIARWTSELDAEEAMHRLQSAGVPAGVSYDDAEIQANVHFRQRGFMELVDHHECGERFVASVPWQISGAPKPAAPRRVPRWGEYNDYVLTDLLELSTGEVQHLVAEGVVSKKSLAPS
jgi:benzylsuccinate CoA-transferase BbsF subunit